MFKTGDVLKTKMDIAETVYEGCKGTTVYNQMMELARTRRFEVLNVVGSTYVLRHLDTDPLVELAHDKAEVHQYFEIDESLTNNNNKEER